MTEFELKFEIPADRLHAVAAALQKIKAKKQRLLASYFDTPDAGLTQRGIVVRVRKEGRRWVQTAKCPALGPLLRLEHNVNLSFTASTTDRSPRIDLSLHNGTEVGAAIAQALDLKKEKSMPELVRLYETDVERLTARVGHGTSTVEIALDQGRIVSGSQTLNLCEIEFELKEGSPEDVVALAKKWCADYGLWLSSITKSMKGQRLRSNTLFAPAVSAVLPKFDRKANGKEIFVAALESCLNQILPNASDLAGGSPDAHQIHQLRVGIRRLRTAMRDLEFLVGTADTAWEEPMVATFRALGRHRDATYLVSNLQALMKADGGPPVHFESTVSSSLPSPQTVVRSPAFQDALLSLIALAHTCRSDANSTGLSHKKAMKVLSSHLGKLHKNAVAGGKKFLSLDEDHQHDVRKRMKRLRYLAEFLAPLFPSSQTGVFVSGLKPPQDALGLYNDEIMGLKAYLEQAEKDQAAWFGAGWLSARRLHNATACQKKLIRFAKIKPFWK